MTAPVVEIGRAAPERQCRPSAAQVPGEVLSPSQASTFLGCPAKWWYKYGLGLPDPAGGGAVRGKAVHSIVAYFMDAKKAGVELPAEGLETAWEHAWDAAAEGAQFSAFDDLDQLQKSGLALTKKYLAEVAPTISPAAVEQPFSGSIGGVKVRGIVDLIDTSGCVIDLKTSGRKSSSISADHAFQLATYTALAPGATGKARLDMLVSTKEPQLVTIEHTPGAAGRRLIERMYPAVAEGIAGGLFAPNRASNLCSRRYCAFADQCEREWGGVVE